MSKLKTTLREKLLTNRGSLSPSSLKTYISTLSRLYKNLSEDFTEKSYDPQVFADKKGVLAFLNDPDNKRNTPSKRKYILSALVVLTDDDDYRKNMNKRDPQLDGRRHAYCTPLHVAAAHESQLRKRRIKIC